MLLMNKNFDLSVYFVADPSVCAGRNVTDVVAAALRGGVSMVQLRDKGASLAIAQKVRDVVAAHNAQRARRVAFLINDHVEIAQEIGADGVHLGQEDMTPRQAREVLGPEAIIGLTAFTEDQIRAVDPAVVDYIGTGPFYETQTKKGKPVLGPVEAGGNGEFSSLIALSSVPVVGIGGITPGNARTVIEAGAQGVAMMRSISEAQDPAEAAQAFKKSLL